MMEPLAAVSRKEEQSEDALFRRLQDVAVAATSHAVHSCTVQGADSEFIVILSDPATGQDLCAWSGSPDAILLEFQHWLERRHGAARADHLAAGHTDHHAVGTSVRPPTSIGSPQSGQSRVERSPMLGITHRRRQSAPAQEDAG
jgi:hypothetical protein